MGSSRRNESQDTLCSSIGEQGVFCKQYQHTLVGGHEGKDHQYDTRELARSGKEGVGEGGGDSIHGGNYYAADTSPLSV
jgi:hypothetical protein